MPESPGLEFLEMFLVNNFALSDAEYNTSELNRGGIADFICWEHYWQFAKKSLEPSFWEVMDSFVGLVQDTSLAASRTFMQQLLVCLSLL